MHLWRWVLTSWFLATACGGRDVELVRVADAVPRPPGPGGFDAALDTLLASERRPRIERMRWSVASQTEYTEGAQAARFISDPTVIAAVGHAGSGGTLLTAPLYRKVGLPLIVPTATARELRTLPRGLYLLAPSDDVLGAFLVDQALDSLGVRRLAVLYVADPYGVGIRTGVVDRLLARGTALAGETVLLGNECATDHMPMRVVIRSLLQRFTPDGLVLALPHPLTACALNELAAEDPSLVLLASDSFVPDERTGLSPAAQQATHVLQLWTPGTDSVTARFRRKVRDVTGREPTPDQAFTFDAFRLAQAAIQSGVRTRSQMRQWLEALGTPNHPAFDGVTGPIDFHRPRQPRLRLKHLTDTSVTP